MQKLDVELKNAPIDAPQVYSTATYPLNRVEKLSVGNGKLASNNLDVDQPQHREGQNLRVSAIVYVLNQRGSPLMPTSPRKAKQLLKTGKAKVIKRFPFVIQLNYSTGETKQAVKCGVDTGYQHVGISVVSNKKELFSAELVLDGKTSDRLTERRMYRRNRRNKLWYRKPRFINRVKKSSWLSPSVQRRLDAQVNLICKVHSILPISELTIEVANFDIQKLNNPDIKGKEYQQGSLHEYENVKFYLLSREHGKCQLCGKDFEVGNGSHVHHIIPRSKGGTDKPDNLSILHKKCHDKLHKNKLFDKLKKNKQYKPSTFMSTIQHRFGEIFEGCKITFGYETKIKRNRLNIEKSHINDAFVISDGTDEIRCKPFGIIQKHRNNRGVQLNRNGFKPSIRKQRYAIQPNDLLTVDNKIYISNGTHKYGKAVVCHNQQGEKFDFHIKKVQKCFHFGSLVWNIQQSKEERERKCG